MVKIGDTIHLEIPKNQDITEEDYDTPPKKYRCRLIDKTDDSFIVEPPVIVEPLDHEDTSESGFFMEGVQLSAWFIGADQAVYYFNTEVTGRAKDKIRSLSLNDPGFEQYARIQRRNYVRINVSVDVAVHPLEEGEFPAFVTTTVDISGGGMALLLPANHTLKEKHKIMTWIVLQAMDGAIHYAKFPCEVIRIIEGKEGTGDRCSLKFGDISDADREIIIKYCFEHQMQNGRNSKSRNR